MYQRSFRRREPLRKLIQCACGSGAKLIKRRNFPHGRKSRGRSTQLYKCIVCLKEYPLSKSQEVKS